MYVRGETLDDLLRSVYGRILRSGNWVSPTKGDNRELFGVVLGLEQPLARLSRTESKGRLFSALGELLWYLAGSDDFSFINYYVPDGYKAEDNGNTVWGAYGPRLFNMRGINQLAQVCDLLKSRPSTRRAVIQFYNAEDISRDHADVPCTCTLQFMARQNRLDLFVSMRSNDAYKGLPLDVFTFTMIQELVARQLDLKLGRYKHATGSLHLYEVDIDRARQYLNEGWQSTMPMPPMAEGDPWHAITVLTEVEQNLRNGIVDVDVAALPIDGYWKDLAALLKIYALTRGGTPIENLRQVVALKNGMASDFYRQYIRRRERRFPKPSSFSKAFPERL